MSKLNELIKREALSAVANSKPVNVLYGEVIQTNPLIIRINQQKDYSEEFLVLTRNVTDYDLYIKKDNGEKEKHTIYNSLEKGEIVILLRVQGGQEFIVWDRRG
ncbi:DUF2577 domain-containing protein [Clostridium butyricum]|uniref:DUF2577 domain-containing protein n=1 Tax=Clostridium butyricum TaxID=1492 RepID=UPI002ABD185B|nr:DUF2577 domain-containing protein [Clostridium butyricum]